MEMGFCVWSAHKIHFRTRRDEFRAYPAPPSRQLHREAPGVHAQGRVTREKSETKLTHAASVQPVRSLPETRRRAHSALRTRTQAEERPHVRRAPTGPRRKQAVCLWMTAAVLQTRFRNTRLAVSSVHLRSRGLASVCRAVQALSKKILCVSNAQQARRRKRPWTLVQPSALTVLLARTPGRVRLNALLARRCQTQRTLGASRSETARALPTWCRILTDKVWCAGARTFIRCGY